jgi:hypothetical protein
MGGFGYPHPWRAFKILLSKMSECDFGTKRKGLACQDERLTCFFSSDNMPGRIKLNAKVTAHVSHLAPHHGYPHRIKAFDIHREIPLSHDISLRTVRERCLAEYRRCDNAEVKTGDSW